jgi:hypothetical protein
MFTQLYRNSNVKNGVLNQLDVPLRYGGNVERFSPYLLDDAAFQLSMHMKNFRPDEAPAGSAKSVLDQKVAVDRAR